MASRVITLPAIRWPIMVGQGWPIIIAADPVEFPSLADVVSAEIRWKSGENQAQTRNLVFDEDSRTNTSLRAAYVFTEQDLASIAAAEDAASEIRAYVTLSLSSGVKKESSETIVLPLNPEFA